MIRDATELEQGARLEADVCIVGAGAAGITLARDLGARGLTVLLFESGGQAEEPETQDLYAGEMTGVGDVGLTDCRLRQFGGTTNRWAGWCRPLDPEVFEARAAAPLGAWPIAHADLVPWYKQAQRTCEIGAFQYDVDHVLAETGKPLLPLAAPADHVFYQYSPPTRFAEVYGPELEQSPTITVYLHANLVDLDFEGAAVSGLQLRTLSGVAFTATARQYVLALGGLENARMLLAARGGQGVGNERDQVGRYFMDHPHFYVSGYMLVRDQPNLDLYLRRTRISTTDDFDPEPREVSVKAALTLTSEARAAHDLMPVAITLRSIELDDALEATGTLSPQAIIDVSKVSPDVRVLGLDIRAEQSPDPESRITLLDTTDALGMPRMQLNWQVGQPDHVQYTQTLRLLGAALGQSGIGRLWMPLDEEELFKPRRYIGGCHHMGTTRMAAEPANGVVDGECRVHGVDNLFMAGSSLFPSAGFANPTLTIVALAHRLAEHIGGLQ
ncbi:MAG: GMC oxidoreductase [Bradymonadia bacterium]